jgi:PHD/YefM family antitoxin component YafN of YafNO toxin-antitoxin module
VIDEMGKRIAVLLDREDYRNLLEELEELDSIRAYDAAKTANDQALLFDQVVAEIEQDRR